MPEDVKPRRTYRSRRRAQQAEETRVAILDAALARFAHSGLAATTIRSVADGAGVAAETVYAAFRSKVGLLTALAERNLSFAGGGPAPLDLVREMLASKDVDRQLELWGRIAPLIWARNWAIVDALRVGAASDSELASAYREASAGRMAFLSGLVDGWQRRGLLRAGMDAEAARDVLWALASPDLYRLLVLERGWSAERYGAWQRDAASRLVL